MTSASTPSFVSYVSEAEKDQQINQKLAKAMSKMYERPDEELEDRLLSGELAIGHAKKVIRYNVHDDPTRGISGTLVCTNFRLCFLTAEKATYDLVELRNRLLDDHDILLNNIESIFVEYPSKRKKLVPGSKVKDGVQRLELHCKDFRVAAFNFKLTVKGEEKGVIKALLHHAYPSTVSLLFAFDYQHGRDVDKACKIPLYRNPGDWEAELRRCGVKKKMWRVTAINRQFTAMNTMAAYFVIPSSTSDSDLSNAADQFMESHLPVWSWTDSSQCSLVRAASLRPEVEQQYYEDKLYEAVRDADHMKRPLKIIDVSKSCPSRSQLQQSFVKLKTLCMPASESDFWESDTHWHSMLHSTKWLQHVSAALETAKTAAVWVREKEHNVIVKGTSGVDLASVTTSLVQLILDPTCRTLEGLQALIQREWIVAGHPFLDRLGHLLQPTKKGKPVTTSSVGEPSKQAPVFLLFLDCVWQLTKQYPARFEASTTFLTVLYDATKMTALDSFIFNDERQRARAIATRESPLTSLQHFEDSSWQSLPVWAWDVQFNKSDMKLFNNPLYRMRMMRSYRQYLEESSSTHKRRCRFLSDNSILYLSSRLKDNTLNGNLSETIAGTSLVVIEDSKARSSPRPIKKKSSLKEKRTEEHRKKIEMDNPLSLKNKHKNDNMIRSSSVGESANRLTDEGKGLRPSAGHFPKVALMPKQRHSAVNRPPSEKVEDDRPSRAKSAGDLFGEDSTNVEAELNGSDEAAPLRPGTAIKVEPGSPKLKTRWSVRRKKQKDFPQEEEEQHGGCPVYTIRMRDYAMQPYIAESDAAVSSALYPCSSIPRLHLWRPCYFRWVPWSQIFGGGPAATLQQESLLYDEIHLLHNKLQALKRELGGDSFGYHGNSAEEELSSASGMYFSFASSQENVSVFEPNAVKSSSQTSLNLLSSYFPYSPVKDLRRRSIIGTPISNFLQGGSLFNFGRARVKHTRSPSSLSITHSLTPSIEDLSCDTATDSGGKGLSSASKSLEDLTSDPGANPSDGEANIRDRTLSDVNQVRGRLKLLGPNVKKPNKVTTPTTPTENITYITAL